MIDLPSCIVDVTIITTGQWHGWKKLKNHNTTCTVLSSYDLDTTIELQSSADSIPSRPPHRSRYSGYQTTAPAKARPKRSDVSRTPGLRFPYLICSTTESSIRPSMQGKWLQYCCSQRSKGAAKLCPRIDSRVIIMELHCPEATAVHAIRLEEPTK